MCGGRGRLDLLGRVEEVLEGEIHALHVQRVEGRRGTRAHALPVDVPLERRVGAQLLRAVLLGRTARLVRATGEAVLGPLDVGRREEDGVDRFLGHHVPVRRVAGGRRLRGAVLPLSTIIVRVLGVAAVGHRRERVGALRRLHVPTHLGPRIHRAHRHRGHGPAVSVVHVEDDVHESSHLAQAVDNAHDRDLDEDVLCGLVLEVRHQRLVQRREERFHGESELCEDAQQAHAELLRRCCKDASAPAQRCEECRRG